jgi:hypothetical protein
MLMSGLKELASNLRNLHNNAVANDVVLARGMAHAKFDLLWKRKIMTRRQAYAWLQGAMEMTEAQAHMEHMDAVQCMQVIDRVNKAFPCLR